jgi:two-component SAPR family response regulator
VGVPSVLVLDDEPALTKLISVMLETRGYTVRGFLRPLEALEALEGFSPDAIISDVSMPQMDGLEFCRRVRENPRFAQVPFIFLSAMAERRDIREGMNVGADDYLTKPFQSDELLDALEVRLKRAETLRAPLASSVGPAAVMQARALGAASLLHHGSEVTWGSRKAAEFFFLLLERPNGVTTWEAAEALWPDKDESRAASVFHTTLHRLRKVLDDELVFTRNRRYYLNSDLALHYDVREYMELAKRAQGSLDIGTFERAINLYQGSYLADFESDWCQDLRETLHGTHLSLLLDASRRAEVLGDARRATWFAHLSTQHDPYSDRSWNELSRLYDGMGDSRRAERARARLETWD